MEYRLLGGLRLTFSLFGYKMLLRFSLMFTVDALTVVLKIDTMYKEHLCAVALTDSAREGSLSIRLSLTSLSNPPLIFFR